MGIKASMILVENPNKFRNDKELLNLLLLENYKYIEDTSFEKCMYPRDNSINIAYYKNCIVICDDFQLTEQTIRPSIHPIERSLMKRFPQSEIISLMCQSISNGHAYSIVKANKTIRVKKLDADKFYFEKGKPVEQEQNIYSRKTLKNGVIGWISDYDPDVLLLEDQLMEEFTFGIASRLLGFELFGSDNNDYFMYELPFKKYLYKEPETFTDKLKSLFTRS